MQPFELYLKTITSINGNEYHYVFNRFLNRWQRVSKRVFKSWLLNYFGLGKTYCEVVSSDYKTTKYKLTKTCKTV